jgi:hypothetical protein
MTEIFELLPSFRSHSRLVLARSLTQEALPWFSRIQPAVVPGGAETKPWPLEKRRIFGPARPNLAPLYVKAETIAGVVKYVAEIEGDELCKPQKSLPA